MSTVLRLKPAEVALHPGNIRDSSRDLAALTASIKEVGVLVPLIVAPVADLEVDYPASFGDRVRYVAIDGNRRLRASADLDVELPCIVADPGERRPELTMAVTNLVRDGLTTMETVTAVQHMLDLQMPQAVIARATGMKPKQVRTAKKAAELPTQTVAAAADHGLNLEQLAALTEFADDPAATKQLISDATNSPWNFERSVEQLRRAAKIARQVEQRREEFRAAGVQLADEYGYTRAHLRKGEPIRLASLVDVDPEAHASCPGRVVVVQRHWDGVDIEECCADPDGNGHRFHPWCDTPAAGGSASGEDPAAAEEARKTERRELIRRNKEMAAAQEVRIRFAADRWRKATPAMKAWALRRLALGDGRFARWQETWSHKVGLCEVIGGQSAEEAKRTAREAPPSQHAGLIWARIVCAEEDEFTKDCWRNGADQPRADYLRHLVDLGYELCETEQLIVDKAAAADGDDIEDDDLPIDDGDGWGPADDGPHPGSIESIEVDEDLL